MNSRRIGFPCVLVLALLCASLVAAMGWSSPGAQEEEGTLRQPSAVARRIPEGQRLAFCIMFESAGHSPSGLVVAAWEDGMVIFSATPDAAGTDLRAGRISAEELKKVQGRIEEAGFFDELKERGQVPDGSEVKIGVRKGETWKQLRWNEALSRPWGAHVGAEEEFYRLARTWALARTAIAFSYPTEYVDIEKDVLAKERYKAWKAKWDLGF